MKYTVSTDSSRDSLLTDFGKSTLSERYLQPEETYQGMFARVASFYADDQQHAQRLYDYISQLWFMPATPILSNGGTSRGLPISCFLNRVEDNMEGIVDTWNENTWLASNGGGIGTYWGNVRSIGESIKGAGESSGIIPFIRVMDSMTLAISQGSLRRGSAAVYLDIHHPEIEEFLEIRKPSGDFNRKSLNIHHGINITDEFMESVFNDAQFGLKSPKTGKVIKQVSARNLWQKILEIRVQTGEPYLLFIDTVNRTRPEIYKKLNLFVTSSNLCVEIVLKTGIDHLNKTRTAVCCLSSLNVEYFDKWKDKPHFIEDIMRFLDNVLEDFINNAPPSMANAVYSAKRERSVGLGLMGLHSYFQSKGIPFASPMAKAINLRIMKHIKPQVDAASVVLANEKGPCLDAQELGINERFTHKIAIAPTASISIIAGNASAGIEPIPANIYVHKTLSGTFAVKNRYLDSVLEEYYTPSEESLEDWKEKQWTSITLNEGSVRNLDYMSPYHKSIFETSMEIDQRYIIELAADRAPYVCQAQSINLFIPADIDKWDLHMLHWTAWEKGVKSLYYLRSKSIQRSTLPNFKEVEDKTIIQEPTMYSECLVCQ